MVRSINNEREEIDMRREIYQVNAMIVDANGTYNMLSGYPKNFDSRSYDNDIDKAQRRALGELNDALGAMYKRDDRPLQVAYILEVSTGSMFRGTFIGQMPEVPDPEPEPVEE